MKERIREACITTGADTLQNAIFRLVNRFHHCINVNGYHFQHLQHYTAVNGVK